MTLNNFFEATHGLVVEVGKTGRESIGGGAHSDVWKASMRTGEVQQTVAVKCVRWYANMEYDSDQATKTLKVLSYLPLIRHILFNSSTETRI